MRMLLFVSLALLAAAGVACAQGAQDYWPMDIGYYWIQHTDSFGGGYLPSTRTLYVEGSDSILGEECFRMRQEERTDGDSLLGCVYAWTRPDTSGVLWTAFGLTSDPDSAITFATPVPFLPNGALNQGYMWTYDIPEMDSHSENVTQSISETVVVPAGTFNNCLKIWTVNSSSSSGDTFEIKHTYYAQHIGPVLNDGWLGEEWESFRWELIEYSVGVDEKKTRVATPRFSLQQNYPNPFGSVTTISYLLPNSEHVSIKVYNIAGVEVATLVDEYRTAGKYSVKWDGAGLSSGIYLTRIVAGNHAETKKAIVLR